MRLPLLIIVLTCFYSAHLISQVTIGSGVSPSGGALLDLKEENSTGANSTRGFLFPRVFLTQTNNLTDIAGTTGVNADLLHMGLCVFNVNPNFAGGIGVYVWNGTQWIVMQNVMIGMQTIFTSMTAFSDPGSNLLATNLGSPIANWKYFTFGNKFVDTKGEYNLSAGVFTTKESGSYDISIRVSLAGLSLLATYGVAVYKKPQGSSNFTLLFSQTKDLTFGLVSIEIEAKSGAQTLNAGDQLMFALRNSSILSLTTGSSALSYGIVTQR